MSNCKNKMASFATNHMRKSHFLHAMRTNDFETATHLLSSGVDVDTTAYHNGDSAMPVVSICIESRNFEMARFLINNGCSLSLVNESGQTPLHVAASSDNSSFVSFLIQNRANVNAKDNGLRTPLHLACSYGSYGIVTALVKGGCAIENVDVDGNTPLIIACISGHASIARYLVENGANVNCVDRLGNTPLFHAVTSEMSLELVSLLLEKGAAVNLENKNGDTVLMLFLENPVHSKRKYDDECLDVIKALLDAGYKVNTCNIRGQNPLHLAVYIEHLHLVRHLINRGCDVNKTDGLGNSPLFYACHYGRCNIVRMLIATDIKWEQEQWLQNEELKATCKTDLVNQCVRKAAEFSTLAEICRSVLRRTLVPDIEAFVKQLEYPITLKNYITLNDY